MSKRDRLLKRGPKKKTGARCTSTYGPKPRGLKRVKRRGGGDDQGFGPGVKHPTPKKKKPLR